MSQVHQMAELSFSLQLCFLVAAIQGHLPKWPMVCLFQMNRSLSCQWMENEKMLF